jgi:hypothetical protein
LQATLGHATGVAFGGAPASKAYTRSATEFGQHILDVVRLWGRRLLQSRILFLAGTDVLHKPVAEVAGYLTTIGSTFLIEPRKPATPPARDEVVETPRFDGVHVFIENFDLARPDRAGWHELAKRGIVRVSLGVESGDSEIRSYYYKRWDNHELRAAVADIKATELGVSLLTLIGAGGVEQAERHREQTVRLIESLELGAGDFVFLLDASEISGPASRRESFSVVRGVASSKQQAAIKDSLAALKKRGIKVLPYSTEKQSY